MASVVETEEKSLAQEDAAAAKEERKQEKLRRDIASFDQQYAHLAEYPEDFKVEVLGDLSRRSHESQCFQDILVSEAVDAWDEKHGL